MKSQKLARWLRTIVIIFAAVGLLLAFWVVPEIGKSMVYSNPEFEYAYYPWLLLIWIVLIPCYLVLIIVWKITDNISDNRSFSYSTADYLRQISILALADSSFFLIMNIVYSFLSLSHAGILLMALFIIFLGICFSLIAAIISHYVLKAAELQDQSDLTI